MPYLLAISVSATVILTVPESADAAANTQSNREHTSYHVSVASLPPLSLKGNLSSMADGSFLIGMNMINAQTGFVAGYLNNQFSIWKTTDSGAHWHVDGVSGVPNYNPNSDSSPPTVSFVSPNAGWIGWIVNVKNHNLLIVLRTTDGGRTWTRHSLDVPSAANYVQQICFLSTQGGWIRAFSGGAMNQGDTSIFHTTNGGRSWKLVSSTSGYIPNTQATPHALPEYDVPMPMAFTSPRDGWVAVGNVVVTQRTLASLYRTTTSGDAWYPVELPVPKLLQHGYATIGFQPVFSHDDGTVTFQYMGTHNEIVSYRTTNGGKTWTASTPLQIGNDQSVTPYFLNPELGWLVGNSGLMKRTVNGGQSWSDVHTSRELLEMLHRGFRIQQLDMVNSKVGWMMVRDDNGMTSEVATRILKTRDGGRTWH